MYIKLSKSVLAEKVFYMIAGLNLKSSKEVFAELDKDINNEEFAISETEFLKANPEIVEEEITDFNK